MQGSLVTRVWPEPLIHRWASVVFLVLGLMQVTGGWHRMNPDGIAYLDMADRLSAGHLDPLAHPYWSPLYPMLMIPFQHIVKLLGFSPFAVAHMLNLLIALLALAVFRWFVKIWLDSLGDAYESRTDQSWRPVLLLLAYGLFTYAVFCLIDLSLVTPDLLVMVLVFAICALTLPLLRVSHDRSNFVRGLMLGAVLGISYWAKTVMLPMALVFIGILAVVFWRKRTHWSTWWGILLVLVAVSAPLALNISKHLGEVSFGKTGSLNYAWFVQANVIHRSSDQPVLSGAPLVLDYRDSVPGTYPIHYDATAFSGGLSPRLDTRAQLEALARNLFLFFQMSPAPWLALALVALATNFRRPGEWAKWPGFILLAFSGAAIGVYLLVLVEGRYVAPFWVMFGLGLAGSLIPSTGRAYVQGFIATLALCLILNVIGQVVLRLNDNIVAQFNGSAKLLQRQAEVLHDHGLGTGDGVLYVGPSAYGWAIYLSKQAGSMIHAEVANEALKSRFLVDHADLQGACEMFSSDKWPDFRAMLNEAGINGVIIENLQCGVVPATWHPLLREGNFFIPVEPTA